MDAIILAGGFGTRLRSVVSDVPKPMAPVGEQPFLSYLLKQLKKQNIQKVILCTGYKHEVIEQFYGNEFLDISIIYSVETEPLGTGGAICKALKLASSENVLVLNGDTMFDVNIEEFSQYHLIKAADISLALKTLEKYDRYGSVNIVDNKVIGFEEKQYKEYGLINGGVYILKRDVLSKFDLPQTFSFEQAILESKYNELNIIGYESDAYFIDIGIPEDYDKAQTEVRALFNE